MTRKVLFEKADKARNLCYIRPYNLKELEDATVELCDALIEFVEGGAVSSGAAIVRCVRCDFYEPDEEYAGLGSCKNDEVNNCFVYNHCDMFLLDGERFGCAYFEEKRT